VLATRLVEIRDTGPAYRGIPVLELVRRGASFEAVAEYLWRGGEFPLAQPTFWGSAPDGRAAQWLDSVRAVLGEHRLARVRATPIGLLLRLLPELYALDQSSVLLTPASEHERGRRLIVALVLGLASRQGKRALERALGAQGKQSLAALLCGALGARVTPRACAALDLALVLSADHELNPSTFAARIAAGTGASLYACVIAALATLSGPLHGGACDRIEALTSEVVGARAGVGSVLLSRARRGETIPGFGHPLYPDGDPRASPLLALARELAPENPRVRVLLSSVRSMAKSAQQGPNLDLGLVALAAALGLAPGSATAIFAVGRCAGWIAHVIEQRERGALLRPRAQYRAESPSG
jgi:citrate synthase